MMSRRRYLLLAMFLLACRKEPESNAPMATGSGDEVHALSVTCAQQLAKASGATSAGNSVKLEHHVIATTVAIEQIQKDATGANTAAGIRVMCEIDGHPVAALTSGSVGLDTTREAALATAIEEWVGQYGTTIVDALGGRGKPRRVGAFDAYAGPTGIRGAKPEQLELVHERFFAEVAPVLSNLSTTSLHAVTLMVVRKPDGTADGEVRLDGEVSAPLKQLAMKVTWPESPTSYMLKQYYVLVAAKN